MRNVYLSVSTLALTAVVICNAYLQKKQFYPSVVYITKSNPSMAIIYLQALIIIWLLGKLLQKVFFGELRAAEIEHLIERFWYAITETCLAFTVFKDDFSPKFIALFALLLFVKVFHWLAEDRVDYMERSPIISWLFHTRVVLLLTLLGLVDLFFISFAYHYTITKGASVQLVFGFEYAILLTVVANTGIKYVLHIIDMNREVFWENKAVFLLHVEVFIGLIKVGLYMMFVVLMIKLYTLPLFAFRPMYYSMRNFKKALNDVIQSRRAIRNMNTLYPHATAEELAAVDNVCIICREEMQVGAKKLPCNHIFHVSCLRSWFQRHQTCPTCRLNVLRPTPENQTPNHGAQPAQPPPPAAHNAGVPPLFAFPAWQPPFMPPPPMPPMNLNLGQQNAPPNAGTTSAPSTSQNQSQETRSDSQRSSSDAGAPPFADPSAFPRQFPFPFMIPPMPSLIPGMFIPPLPPQNWTGLSVDELRQMEDAGRQGVEARLQCLRNIHTLMDASVILMQQYIMSSTIASASTAAAAAAAAASGPVPQTSGDGSGGATSSATAAAAAAPAAESAVSSQSTPTTSASSSQSNIPTQSSVSQSTLDSSSSSSSEKSNVNYANNQKSTLDQSSSSTLSNNATTAEDNASASTDEQEDIRRRRVNRFNTSW